MSSLHFLRTLILHFTECYTKVRKLMKCLHQMSDVGRLASSINQEESSRYKTLEEDCLSYLPTLLFLLLPSWNILYSLKIPTSTVFQLSSSTIGGAEVQTECMVPGRDSLRQLIPCMYTQGVQYGVHLHCGLLLRATLIELKKKKHKKIPGVLFF